MACIICQRSHTPQSRSLTNGSFVHNSCINKLENQYRTLARIRADSIAKLKRLRSELESCDKLSGRLKRFFSRHSPDLESLKRDVQIAYAQAQKAVRDESSVRNELEEIYDFWPDYPPNWKSRRSVIQERDEVCTECGARRRLDVHHIKPLAKGGTNKPDNLVFLCRPCHQNLHGYEIGGTDPPGKRPPSPFERKVAMINEAIAKNRNIQFRYKKRKGTRYIQRTVSPYRLDRVQHNHQAGFTLCVKGHCHLRSADRTFALDDRMKGLKIIQLRVKQRRPRKPPETT